MLHSGSIIVSFSILTYFLTCPKIFFNWLIASVLINNILPYPAR